MQKRKKTEREPIPSEEKILENNPVFRIKKIRYTGEEARKARAHAERRARRNRKVMKYIENGAAQRWAYLKAFCLRWANESFPHRLVFSEDTPDEQLIKEIVAGFVARPSDEAFQIGYFLGHLIGLFDAETTQKAQCSWNTGEADTKRGPTLKGQVIRAFLGGKGLENYFRLHPGQEWKDLVQLLEKAALLGTIESNECRDRLGIYILGADRLGFRVKPIGDSGEEHWERTKLRELFTKIKNHGN